MAPVPKEAVEELRQGLPAARRRQRPVQADHVRPGRPDDAVRPATTAYHWPGLPYVDQVEYRWGVDAGVQILELQAARPTCWPTASTREPGADAARPAAEGERLRAAAPRAALGEPRPERQPLFKDKVRQALNYATDRDALRARHRRHGVHLRRAVPEGPARLPAHLPALRLRPGEGEGAAGRGRRREASRSTSGSSDSSDETKLGQILQQQWAAVGINAKIRGEANADALTS